MRGCGLALLLTVLMTACSSTPPGPREPGAGEPDVAPSVGPGEAPAPPEAGSASTAAPEPSASAAPPGAPGAGGSSGAATGKSQACPADMVLIDGDYCSDLEVTCLKKWHAPQNNLWVCEKVKKPTRCVGTTRHMRYCIDRYEFPNRKGVRPMVMQNFYQAQVHCAKRGKRVCTESEWTKACEGPENKPFPYGYTRDAKKCHGDQPWDWPSKKKVLHRDPVEIERLWQGVLSGSQPDCVSDYGVHDLPANADELAASEKYGGAQKADFDNVTTGGPWYLGVRNQCRPKIYTHDESFAYYYLSWRCCQEADGKPTDPRAPKQIKRNMKWERVKWLAEHSWMLPFNPKVPGEPGYSAAGPDRKPVAPKK